MNSRKAAWIVLSAVFAIGGGAYLTMLLKRDQGEDLTKQLDIKQDLNAQVAMDAKVRDENGKEVPFRSLLNGRPLVLMLVFYGCKTGCTVEFESSLKTFRDMKTDTIGESYDVATVSIHPKETTQLAVAKKNEMLDRYLAGREEKEAAATAGWHFLTGDQIEVQKIADSVGYRYTYNREKDRVVHPTALVILTPQGRVSRYLIGTNYSSPFVRESLIAAGQNVIGEQATTVSYFGCFTYDPTTGKTMLHVKGALQLLGALTLITMIASIVSMNRRFKIEHGLKEASGEQNPPA